MEYRTLASDGRTRWVNAVGRFYYDTEGNPTRFDGVTLDISARKAAEEQLRLRVERERFLADLAERARRMSVLNEVIADAVRSVGEFLGVSRCLFADIDIKADTCAVPPHFRADDAVASIAGVFPISAFGPFVVAEYKAGRTAVVDDVRADRVKAPPRAWPHMRPSASAPTLPRPCCTRPASSPPSRSTAPSRGTGRPRRWNSSRPWWSGRG